MSRSRSALLLLLLLAAAGVALAQRWGRWAESFIPDHARTAREVESHSVETPMWTNPPAFARDVWTFVRVRYQSGARWSRGGWGTDCPDSDLNLSWRLQQLTSIKVNPAGRLLALNDPEIFDHPWLYMVEPGGLTFTEEEVDILRRYLLNGGFLMADDFWGEYAWQNFAREMKRVFPDREPVDLAQEHPIFHCVFDIKLPLAKMQIPNAYVGMLSEQTGVTWERHFGEECQDAHFRAISDDRGRMMVFIAHNTDNGDGWEREGENEYFFREFSEKIGYPLGINVVFYALTH